MIAFALVDDVEAEAGAAALIGAEQPAEHADEGGFAAAVGAEEAANLAGAHLEIDVIDRGQIAEAFGHSADIDGELAIHFERTKFHVDGLAGMQFRGDRRHRKPPRP